jgi:hypothetical protein
MLNVKKSQFASFSVLSIFVGGCLSLIPLFIPVQAQTVEKRLFLAQTGLPQLQSQSTPIIEFGQNNQNYQNYPSQTTQYQQYGASTQRYIVYVNSDNYEVLQRVRQIESSAYIRELNGSRVIQSGVFSQRSNAQRRVSELELYGIPGAGILSFSNTQGMSSSWNTETFYPTNPPSNSNNNFGNNVNNVNMTNPTSVVATSNAYYVIIPTDIANLALMGQEIQQKTGFNTNVFLRTQPRGPHIAVGGFTLRAEAEQWNNYLKNLGYGNARVYYGQ